jgi:hypothetical protein
VAVVADDATIVKAAAALGCDVESLLLPMVRKIVTVAGESVSVEFTSYVKKARCKARRGPHQSC